MNWKALYTEHLQAIARHTELALSGAREHGAEFDGIVFHTGTTTYYHADDHNVLFHPAAHFARWTPVAGPDHLLHFVPGAAPRLVQVVPEDYWYEPVKQPDHPYAEVLDVVRVATPADARKALGKLARTAYIGPDPATAKGLGIAAKAVEPAALVAQLDWYRAYKTPYEAACIREAARIAALGHRVVRAGVGQRLSEREMHVAYLGATEQLESDCPYTNIIAWDECSAVLHYQSKRTTRPQPGACLLIDAGATCNGYASDITRTYVRDGIHPAFRQVLDRMEVLQLDLVSQVGPDGSYVALQDATHRGVADILSDVGVFTVEAAEAYERGLTRPFFPHGVGHHLGLQVHDIGGRQTTPDGERRDPPPNDPYLRTTRPLEVGHVVTVEPGLYFIPMLLAPFRGGRDSEAFDWNLVNALVRCGGVRVEDDVLVTASGNENLTRPHVD